MKIPLLCILSLRTVHNSPSKRGLANDSMIYSTLDVHCNIASETATCTETDAGPEANEPGTSTGLVSDISDSLLKVTITAGLDLLSASATATATGSGTASTAQPSASASTGPSATGSSTASSSGQSSSVSATGTSASASASSSSSSTASGAASRVNGKLAVAGGIIGLFGMMMAL